MAKSQTVYLDYAAATPLDSDVLKAMDPYFSHKFYNPSSIYLASKQVKNDLNQARQIVAKWFGAKRSEVVFTAGGTEANNLALIGIMANHKQGHIVTTGLEHDSIRSPINHLKASGFNASEVNPDKEGIVDPKSIAKAVKDSTVLVSVMYANNEIGTIQPIKQIGEELNKIKADRLKRNIKTPLYFHSDACQAANYLDLHVHKLGVDLMTINGGKIYGPKQSAVLFVSAHAKLTPIIFGGGQEGGLRNGTENVAGSFGLACALDKAQNTRKKEAKRLLELQTYFFAELFKKIPTAQINGSLKNRLPNNMHITLPGQDNERLLFALDEKGIQAAAGAACSASKAEPSHVLRSIGKSDAYARSSLRLTMGRTTTKSQLDYTLDVLANLI